MRKRINADIGKRFGRWVVVKANISDGYHSCLCDCGTLKNVYHHNLVRGKSTSCGCFAREMSRKRATHGMAGTPEYQTWNRMWSRCTNPIVERYKNYGGRGIKVCERWLSFESFYEDMGAKPSPRHSIGRIDNNGNYCPENCRWETQEEQKSNTSRTIFIAIDGKKRSLIDVSDDIGVRADCLRQRVRAGMEIDALLSKKHLKKVPITVNGETKLTTEWMKYANIPISSFYLLKRKGMSSEDIVSKYLTKEYIR